MTLFPQFTKTTNDKKLQSSIRRVRGSSEKFYIEKALSAHDASSSHSGETLKVKKIQAESVRLLVNI